MKLRDHPLMTYRSLRSWPPAWTWVGGTDNQRPKGEVGILKEVKTSYVNPADRIFIYMDYKGASYIGCLLIDHQSFCSEVGSLLQDCCGRPIQEIGDLDVSHTL